MGPHLGQHSTIGEGIRGTRRFTRFHSSVGPGPCLGPRPRASAPGPGAWGRALSPAGPALKPQPAAGRRRPRPTAHMAMPSAMGGMAGEGANPPFFTASQSARKMEPSTPTGLGSLLNSTVRASRHSLDSCAHGGMGGREPRRAGWRPGRREAHGGAACRRAPCLRSRLVAAARMTSCAHRREKPAPLGAQLSAMRGPHVLPASFLGVVWHADWLAFGIQPHSVEAVGTLGLALHGILALALVDRVLHAPGSSGRQG